MALALLEGEPPLPATVAVPPRPLPAAVDIFGMAPEGGWAAGVRADL